MTARYLLAFRLILAGALALLAAYSPPEHAAAWLLFPAYVGAAAAWSRLSRREPGLDVASFIGDIVFTTAALYAAHSLTGELSIAYFMVILASCLLGELRYSLIVALVASGVYAVAATPPEGPLHPPFLLRCALLMATALFSSFIAEVAREASQKAAERVGQQLAWMQRLSQVGQALAAVLHEVKTPVATIMLSAENARRGLKKGDESAVELELHEIEAEAARAAEILRDHLEFTKPTELELRPTRLDEIAARAAEKFRTRLEDRGIVVESALAPAVVRGSERHLLQAVLNLLGNALEACPFGGKITLSCARAGHWAELTVADTGAGMSPEVIERLFEPFSSTRLSEGGHGLGLFVARWIAHKHHGELLAHSDGRGKGARMVLRLPAAP